MRIIMPRRKKKKQHKNPPDAEKAKGGNLSVHA